MERQQEEGLGHQGRLSGAARGRERNLGRAGAFSLGLIVGFLVLGYAALRVLELEPRSAPVPQEPEQAAVARGKPAPRWTARLALGPAALEARLLPLHDEPALQGFRAGELRARYTLGAGEPWRLYLSMDGSTDGASGGGAGEPGAAAPELRSARVVDDQGTALVPFAEVARPIAAVDPIHALYAAAPGALVPSSASVLVLWGREPGAGARLELVAEGADASAELEPGGAEEGRPDPRWLAGSQPVAAPERSLEDEVVELRHELEREKARRAEREQAFLEFSKMLAELPGQKPRGPSAAELEAPLPPSPEEQEKRKAEEAARARATAIGRSLSVLMRLEGLRGLDLLETGTLLSGDSDAPAAIGPVVFRCLDERGLLTGSLNAGRLHLEASQSARSLTIVLEQGFESRGGERLPFENGVRRITISDVDPGPWLEECPELFHDADLGRGRDDGCWDLSAVRRELNRLLGLDTRTGWYRLHSLGGVRGSELFDVQLEELETSGHLKRRLFADHLAISLEDGGVVLALADGAVVHGDEKQPFRDGNLRIVLAGLPLDEWRKAALPGLSPPPTKKSAAPSGARNGQ